jgi:hypothetical protein
MSVNLTTAGKGGYRAHFLLVQQAKDIGLSLGYDRGPGMTTGRFVFTPILGIQVDGLP